MTDGPSGPRSRSLLVAKRSHESHSDDAVAVGATQTPGRAQFSRRVGRHASPLIQSSRHSRSRAPHPTTSSSWRRSPQSSAWSPQRPPPHRYCSGPRGIRCGSQPTGAARLTCLLVRDSGSLHLPRRGARPRPSRRRRRPTLGRLLLADCGAPFTDGPIDIRQCRAAGAWLCVRGFATRP